MTGIPISQAAAERRRRFLTVAETAELLGLSTSTVQRAIRSGDFPAIKVRGRYVVPARALDDLENAALAVGLVDVADHAAPRQRPGGAPAGQTTNGHR
jgi:excisionase family DNA binding protein